MVLTNWLSLRRLRRAIHKVKFLLSFNINKWRLSSGIGSSSRRQLSFKEPPGLIFDDDHDQEAQSSPQILQRTASDDIDRRAEMFISNFYRRLQMERQVSLELRYCKEKSLERTYSD
ncbi:cotton fiber protein [Tasmannia lanceolata]|uniref:cotton fiber protein n=1 Tax=Tasmannia lanceolata TaxID=3420 RepID=UPI004064C2B3